MIHVYFHLGIVYTEQQDILSEYMVGNWLIFKTCAQIFFPLLVNLTYQAI